LPARINFRLEARDGDAVPFDAFAEMVRRIASVLSELDIATPGTPSVRWLIRDLRVGSAVVALEAHPLDALIDTSPQIARQFTTGMTVVALQQERPAWFSDRAWEDVRAVVDVLHDGVARLQIDSAGVALEVTGEVHLPGAAEEAAAGEEGESAGGQEVITSVEGRIGTVYGHDPTRLRFVLWDAIGNAKVTCVFAAGLEEDVRRGLFERVRVHGLARFDVTGRPDRITVDSIAVLDRKTRRPSVSEMRGLVPDLTGGVPAEVWVRQIRDV
jgi:hypothetical protein